MMTKIWKFGSDVDTDQIVPGRYAPYMRPNEDVANAAFIESRPDYNIGAVPGDIIIAEDNFGCGSSREYAPLALKRRQVGAIIANSFARIFYRNSVNLGIPLFVAPEVVTAFFQGDFADIDLSKGTISKNKKTYKLPALPNFAIEIIDAGGIVEYYKEYGQFPDQGTN
jgi:methanogen homoaconitase small subunit